MQGYYECDGRSASYKGKTAAQIKREAAADPQPLPPKRKVRDSEARRKVLKLMGLGKWIR
jgi:hypothetical protein